MSLPTPSELREFADLSIDRSNSPTDAILQASIETAVEILETHTGRNFFLKSETRILVPPVDSDHWVIGEYQDIVHINESGETLQSFTTSIDVNNHLVEVPSHFPTFPRNEIYRTDGGIFSTQKNYQILGDWGWAVVPQDMRMAILIESKKIYQSRKNSNAYSPDHIPYKGLSNEAYLISKRYIKTSRIFV